MSVQNMSRNYIQRDLGRLELADLGVYLDKLKSSEEVAELIHNIYGIAGIGKTYVLQQLFDTFQDKNDVIWLGFDLKDDADAGEDAHNQHPLSLTRASWTEVIAALGVIPGLRGRLPSQITFDDTFSLPLERMGDILWTHKLDGTYQRPLLLLLDSLDNVPYWKWLQEQVIKPLLELQRTLIVCASQTPLFWHFWEIRECCAEHPLSVFQSKETRQFLKLYHRELLNNAVHDLTGGYPLALKQFIHLLNEPAELTLPLSASPLDTISVLLPDTRDILRQTGILRRVHVSVMQALLNRTLPGKQWEDSDQHQRLVAALAEMKAHGYIKPHRDTSDRFAPELRAALKAELPHEEYLDRCQMIADSYYDIAYKQPKTEAIAFVEWLYFSTEQFVTHPDAYRGQWEEDLNKLLMRLKQVAHTIPNVGPEWVGWLYTDGELIRKLLELRLLLVLRKELRPLVKKKTGFVSKPVWQDVCRSCSDALEELGARFVDMAPQEMVPFEPALRSMVEAEEEQFDQVTLRGRMVNKWPLFRHRPARSRTELIIILSGSGILSYDRERRVHWLNPVVKQLLSVESARAIQS